MKKPKELVVGILSVTGTLLLAALGLWLNFRPQIDTTGSSTIKNNTVKATPAVEKTATDASLLAAVNAERAKYGAAPLTEDPRLDASAQAKACDEYNNHYFGHINPSGVRGDTLAENALSPETGLFDENLTKPIPVTTKQVMFNWVNSKVHHDGMTDKRYTLTGFGICGDEIVEHFYGASQ